MSIISPTPYQRNNSDKLQKYNEKLKQRQNNQDWIFANYFGNPGGGAPIKDKTGKVITKIKTIADNHIYLYPSQEFSKVDQEVKKEAIDQQRLNYPIQYEHLDQPPQNYLIDANHQLQHNDYNYEPNQYHQPHLTQKPLMPYYLPMPSHLSPYPSSSPDPYPYQNPYVSPYPTYPQYPINLQPNPSQLSPLNYIPAPNSIPPQPQPQPQPALPIPPPSNQSESIKTKEDSIDFQRSVNQIISYALPQESKDKTNKEVQKELWKKELLIQMQEKKEREKYEKKRIEDSEKQDEIKYQAYLQIKKEQAEQQEQKRRNKIQQKAITQEANDSSNIDLGLMNINNSNNENINYDSSIANKLTSPYRNINMNINNQPLASISSNQNNNMNNNNNNLILQTQSDDDYNQYNNFKSLVDSQYHLLNQSLKDDFDKEMKRISEDYELKYSDENKEIMAQIRDQPSQLINQVLQSEKRLKHLQDMIDQRRLVDYILVKERNPNIQLQQLQQQMLNSNDIENNESINSYFGKNNDKQSRYLNLQSTSSFVYDNKISYQDRKAMTLNEVNDIRQQLQQKGVCYERSLDNVSTFHPFTEDVKNKIKLLPSQKEKGIDEESAFGEMFEKLDDIAELSKQIDKTVKYQTIKSNYEIDRHYGQKG